MASPLSRQRWIVAVDLHLMRDWCISISDAGLGEDDLKRYWREGYTPEVFVAWFAEKYDLIRFESSLPPSRAA